MDCKVTYQWTPGSIPPPDYHEVEISISAGGVGHLSVRPDYGFNDPPVWDWSFDISDTQVSRLADLVSGAATARGGSAEPDVGGVQECVMEDCDGRERRLAPNPKLVAEFRAAVPASLWEEIEARLAAYRSGDEAPHER